MADEIVTRCAVCQLSDGQVINTIVALPSDPPQDGCQLVEIMNGQQCNIGWTWDGSQFIPPPAEPDYSTPVVPE